MNRAVQQIVVARGFHRLLYSLIRLYSKSFRFNVENEAEWIHCLEKGGRVILCTWHQQFFSAIRPFKRYAPYRPALMISRSVDGEVIAGVAQLTGWHTVRGSSSRGGSAALKEMIRHMRSSGLAGHIMDGPRGPMGRVKAGAIRLAQAADAAIVPFYVSADRAWYFNSWDRFFIPKPFARVTLRFGDMIRLPATDQEADFETLRLQVETIMRKELRLSVS